VVAGKDVVVDTFAHELIVGIRRSFRNISLIVTTSNEGLVL
jgi:hypothetical protein